VTLYAACLSHLGLSQSNAAALHGVRIDTVKSWATGRNRVPTGAWDDLRAYAGEIVAGAEDLATRMPESVDRIEINDSEAAGAPLMAAAMFVLSTPQGLPVALGKTEATIAAREARKWAGD
jgi:hypothetical protein